MQRIAFGAVALAAFFLPNQVRAQQFATFNDTFLEMEVAYALIQQKIDNLNGQINTRNSQISAANSQIASLTAAGTTQPPTGTQPPNGTPPVTGTPTTNPAVLAQIAQLQAGIAQLQTEIAQLQATVNTLKSAPRKCTTGSTGSGPATRKRSTCC